MEKVSAHESILAMHEKTKADGIESVAERFDNQGKRCGFCEKGISCQLCSLGPCRITAKASKGACGIGPDAMAMRNLLHNNIMGISAYTYHAVECAKTLKEAANGSDIFSIQEPEKLKAFATTLGISTDGDVSKIANDVADFMIAEINSDSDTESKMVEAFAPPERKELWRKLGIFPGGPLHECMSATTASMTNVDTSYVSLALKALRLGVASTYGALVPLEMCHDILFTTPKPHKSYVDLGIIEKDYVNIVVNGHEPFVGASLIKVIKDDPTLNEKARAAGAKGIHIVGSIETGQELMQRFECDDVFVGLTGNWLTEEYVLATGAVDVFASDMNCTTPTLGEYAKKYNATIVPVSKLVALEGVDKRVNFNPKDAKNVALELINIAIANYNNRKDKGSQTSDKKTEVITGCSTEAVLGVLGGSLDPLLDAIKGGTVKGVVALISCTTLTNGPQDALTISVAKELIKRDILVLSAGCGNAALQVAGLTTAEAADLAGDKLGGLCKALSIPPILSFGTCSDTGRIANLVTAVAGALGVGVSDLPVAVTAPEYLEQKAVIDAFFAVAFGLYTHVSPTPPVLGAPELVSLLTEGVEEVTGGKIAVGDDPVAIVDGIEAHINKKRAALGI
ncbi:anaerobic carbon-monoxide dehydrogenase catalytic subunit [Thermodesulfobacteriota bacterium]